MADASTEVFDEYRSELAEPAPLAKSLVIELEGEVIMS